MTCSEKLLHLVPHSTQTTLNSYGVFLLFPVSNGTVCFHEAEQTTETTTV